MSEPTLEPVAPAPTNFIREIIEADNRSGKFGGRVHTRFPPEPNGYLHIGHAKSICLNFGIAQEYGGKCNLRFDDTNPTKEEVEYVDSIIEDVRWLGFDWEDRLFYASDYFEQLYEWAVQLIKKGKAYVCDLSADEIREYRGTLDRAGQGKPLPQPLGRGEPGPVRAHAAGRVPGRRARPARQDRHGLRQPQPARPGHVPHPARRRITAPATSGASTRCTTAPTASRDSIEGITHSICTLEFEDHRPLYDWFLEQLGIYHPQQIEFARLNLTYTVMSKRKLLQLVQDELRQRLGRSAHADPLRPCAAAATRRRRSATSATRIGVAKNQQHHRYRPARALRARGPEQARPARAWPCFDPLKVVIDNYPEGQVEELEAVNNPEDAAAGTRKVPFSRVLYIEQDDFREDPPQKFFRLAPGREVRLRYAYFITCTGVVKDAHRRGRRAALHLRSRHPRRRRPRRPQGEGHHPLGLRRRTPSPAEVRLYDRLFLKPDPDDAPGARTGQTQPEPELR